MKILERIDGYIEKIETEIDPRILENSQKGGKDYDNYFRSMLKKWGVKSFKDLPKDKQDKFFDAIDKGWKSKKEKAGKK